MPPKNKGKAKKGKKGAGDSIEEKYKRTVHQVESLKDQLVLRRDIARQALLVKEEWKARLQVLKNDLNEEQDVKKAIHSDMTRQYKTMRSDMDLRVHQLEIEVSRLQQQLRQPGPAAEQTGNGQTSVGEDSNAFPFRTEAETAGIWAQPTGDLSFGEAVDTWLKAPWGASDSEKTSPFPQAPVGPNSQNLKWLCLMRHSLLDLDELELELEHYSAVQILRPSMLRRPVKPSDLRYSIFIHMSIQSILITQILFKKCFLFTSNWIYNRVGSQFSD
ncbi:dynein regulatory complex protein 12 isoform X1 [Heterodontus francisci]|uniref:dynein regulatory complex protein 12 isoform X1 n=1 Tax=Heterodontus francisci TaxID=7792 RepID=UPI00355B44F4